MNERNMLKELLDDFGDDISLCDVCHRPSEDCEACKNEQLADYLIANGVTVQERRMYTHDELKTMNGQPVWVEELNSWALVEVDENGQWAGIPFAYARSCYWNVINRNLHCWNMPKPPKGVDNG